MWAIISDIHSNYEALLAVADDIERHSVERVICLGDIVGAGPNPVECVDLIMGCEVVLKGDFDQKLFEDMNSFGPGGREVMKWTRDQLLRDEGKLRFLESLPLTATLGDHEFVHGSPRNPLHEYVFPEDVHNLRKLEKVFDAVVKYCFKGHTHVPGVFTQEMKYLSPAEVNNFYRLDGRKTIIDVGSVGQPRDGDPRACYVLLDDGMVIFRRIDYDVDKTRGKIFDNPDFDKYLGDRLLGAH